MELTVEEARGRTLALPDVDEPTVLKLTLALKMQLFPGVSPASLTIFSLSPLLSLPILVFSGFCPGPLLFYTAFLAFLPINFQLLFTY